MYITFNKETKKVIKVDEKKPIIYFGNLDFAEYYGEIPKNDYLTVTNLREETKTFTEVKYEPKLDENGNYVYGLDGEIELLPITEEKTRTYVTCDLLANFYPPKTEEQLAKEKEKQYNNVVEMLIRKKYSQGKVESIHSNYLKVLSGISIDATKKQEYISEFMAFQEYRNECKTIAIKQVYGN